MRLGARQFKGSKPDIESVVRELRASLAIVDSAESVEDKKAVGEVSCHRDIAQN